MRLDDAIAAAKRSRWLSAQSQSFQSELSAILNIRQVKRGNFLFQVEDDLR